MVLEKYVISGPNGLSKCPESREMDFGRFGETYTLTIFLILESKPPTVFEQMDLKWLLRGGWTGPAQPPGPSPSPGQRKWNRNGTGMEPKPPEIQIYL